MDDVTVRMVVPVGHPDVENYPIEFYSWLPVDEADHVCLDDGNRSLTLSAASYWDGARSPTVMPLSQIVADVTLRKLPAELIDGISDPPDYSGITDFAIIENNPHIALAKEIVQFVIDHVNRLISYARSHHGQYLLTNIPPMHHSVTSSLLKLKAKIRVGNGDWKSWRPPGGTLQWTAMGYRGSDRAIHKDDWPEVKRFIISNERTDLVRELLAGAEALADQGHRRAAITEAVTALEVAMHAFAKNPKSGLLNAVRWGLTGGESLKKQVERMGLTASVRYLFPLILPEDQCSADVLQACATALELRHNVVHNGHRDVNEQRLLAALKAIRRLSLTLERLTEQ